MAACEQIGADELGHAAHARRYLHGGMHAAARQIDADEFAVEPGRLQLMGKLGPMARFARELSQSRPALLLAYANTLGLFAKYVKEAGIRGIRPRAM